MYYLFSICQRTGVQKVPVLRPRVPDSSELFVTFKILSVNVRTLWPTSYARLYTYFEVFLVVTLHVCYFIFSLTDRPQTLDVQDIDPNYQAAVKRRLPQEVKQKLSKVARLSVMFCHTILYMSANASDYSLPALFLTCIHRCLF
jgi:hypothetical protein